MAPEATSTASTASKTNGASDTTFASSSKVGAPTPSMRRASTTGLDLTSFLSTAAKTRPAQPIRGLFPLEQIPGMLSLLAGKPNPETFPFESIEVNLKPSPGSEAGAKVTIAGDDLYQALQYGPTSGLPRLNAWLVELQQKVHRRNKDPASWQVALGVGSQDLLTKTFEALLNAGDTILCESPAYAGILPSLASVHAEVVAVDSDSEGVSATHLASLLSNWYTDPSTATKPFPKALYTTPTGANPSGTTSSEQRKRDVIALSRQFNILILEDDPYFFLNFEGLGQDPVTRERPLSYFALDGEDIERSGGAGRVLRYDSFSKVLSGGMRLGFMSAHPTFIAAVDLATAANNLQTSGVAQGVALSILEHWTLPGFLEHCDRVSQFYKERRDRFESTARRVLGKSPAVAEWVTPTAGMFLWLKLLLPPTPDAPQGDSYQLISKEAKEAGVLAVPGVGFMPDASKSCYVRTSFSLIDEADFEEAFLRLRRVIEDKWKHEGKEIPQQQ